MSKYPWFKAFNIGLDEGSIIKNSMAKSFAIIRWKTRVLYSQIGLYTKHRLNLQYNKKPIEYSIVMNYT
jgi:hypothetical protein